MVVHNHIFLTILNCSSAFTARVIWLCACVRYWPYRGCVTIAIRWLIIIISLGIVVYFAGKVWGEWGNYILARSDHQSEGRKFSYQPIRKLETIQMFALFPLSVLFTSLASLELLCLCQKMADEQPTSQPSQLDEGGLNKLEETVEVKIVPVVAPCKAEKLMSVQCRRRAKLARPFRQLCQTANAQIVQLTSTLLHDLFSACSTGLVSFFFQTFWSRNYFLKLFFGCILKCLFYKHLQ